MSFCPSCKVKTNSVKPKVFEVDNKVLIETLCESCGGKKQRVISSEKELDELGGDLGKLEVSDAESETSEDEEEYDEESDEESEEEWEDGSEEDE